MSVISEETAISTHPQSSTSMAILSLQAADESDAVSEKIHKLPSAVRGWHIPENHLNGAPGTLRWLQSGLVRDPFQTVAPVSPMRHRTPGCGNGETVRPAQQVRFRLLCRIIARFDDAPNIVFKLEVTERETLGVQVIVHRRADAFNLTHDPNDGTVTVEKSHDINRMRGIVLQVAPATEAMNPKEFADKTVRNHLFRGHIGGVKPCLMVNCQFLYWSSTC